MSDSRYGIIEKLTQEKLSLIKEKAEIDLTISDFDSDIINTKIRLSDKIQNLKEQIIREQQLSKERIANITKQKTSLVKNRTKQLESIKERVVAIDEAIKSLKEISKLHQNSESHTQQKK